MNNIQILVKNPAAQMEDFKLEMDLTKTVAELKAHLNQNYPGNPSSDRQKLIFSGKLLVDSQTLAEVFKSSDNKVVQTIHIVVSKAAPSSPPQTQPQFQQPQFQPQQFQQPQFQQFQQPQFQPFHQFGQHVHPNLNLEQQQFLQQQFLQQQRIAAQQFAQFQMQMRAQMGNQPLNQQQPLQRPVQPAQEEGRRPRDSTFWLVLRLSVMVYILSQGGSTTRTLVLSFGALLVFLYQTGVFRVTATYQPNQPNVPGQPQTQDQQNIPGQRGLIAEFILPFFYSLLPTWQPNTQVDAPAPAAPQVPDPVEQVMG